MVGNIGQCLNKKGLSLWSHEQEKVQIRIFQSCKSLHFLHICLPGFFFFSLNPLVHSRYWDNLCSIYRICQNTNK